MKKTMSRGMLRLAAAMGMMGGMGCDVIVGCDGEHDEIGDSLPSLQPFSNIW